MVINKSMNETIYRCFEYLSPEDVSKFKIKFQNYQNDDWQLTHTYRELLLGAHLCSLGYNARHEIKLDLQTPDWSIFDKDQKIKTIIETASFHPPKAIEDERWKSLGEKGVFFSWHSDNTNRLYDRIRDKVTRYQKLVEKYELSFVVAIFDQSFADIQPNEIQECLFEQQTGIFSLYSELSGALFFRDGFGDSFPSHYHFEYMENPHPVREFHLA